MSQIEKLINRMLDIPKDFTPDELAKVMKHFGHMPDNCGGGSIIKYYRDSDGSQINFHLPHGKENALPRYVLQQVIRELKDRGDLK